MEGNQATSLPQNLGRLRGFSILILNCGDQGDFLPRSEWKVTNGLRYLGTWIVTTKGLLFLDLDGIWNCSWRFVHGDVSFENLFMEICPLKIYSWRFFLWRFLVRKIGVHLVDLYNSRTTTLWSLHLMTLICMDLSLQELDLEKFRVYLMKLCSAKVWIYLTGFDMGDLT